MNKKVITIEEDKTKDDSAILKAMNEFVEQLPDLSVNTIRVAIGNYICSISYDEPTEIDSTLPAESTVIGITNIDLVNIRNGKKDKKLSELITKDSLIETISEALPNYDYIALTNRVERFLDKEGVR